MNIDPGLSLTASCLAGESGCICASSAMMLVGKETYKSCESHIGSCHSARIDRAKFFWQKHGSGSLRGSSLLSILRIFYRARYKGPLRRNFLTCCMLSVQVSPCSHARSNHEEHVSTAKANCTSSLTRRHHFPF